MKKHNFKIGDNVRLTRPHGWGMSDLVGTIVGFDSYIRVTWDSGGSLGERYPHLPNEIKYIPRKGEQLMFSFMTLKVI